MTERLPGFCAEASLTGKAAHSWGLPAADGTRGSVRTARIARREAYGCGMNWHLNQWCCRFWAPGGDIVVCCPADGGGPCSTHPGLMSATLGQDDPARGT